MAFEPWRYPGIFNLNQSASLPNAFGPPNMSQQFQSGISALADPILAKMKEQQAATQSKTFYDVVGRSSTDSQGTATNYDARGRVASATRRSSPSAKHASQSGTWVMDWLSAVT